MTTICGNPRCGRSFSPARRDQKHCSVTCRVGAHRARKRIIQPLWESPEATLYCGGALEVLNSLAPASVQTIVSSPPYWPHRDYGEAGQLGREKTVELYVTRTCEIFSQARRVLRPDGTLWLNLGDTYQPRTKQLLLIPARVALALQATGWVLRAEYIWEKTNFVPTPATDRPQMSHEHIFLFSRSARGYYIDLEHLREPAEYAGYTKRATRGDFDRGRNRVTKDTTVGETRGGRTVWRLPTETRVSGHGAVMGREVAERCVRAGARPGDVVLDPFCGSATVGCAALELGAKFVGIDLSERYLTDIARLRLLAQPRALPGLLAREARPALPALDPGGSDTATGLYS